MVAWCCGFGVPVDPAAMNNIDRDLAIRTCVVGEVTLRHAGS